MLLPRSRTTTFLLGTLATASIAAPMARSEDYVRIADRCAVYGSGFVDLGNGTCGQAGGHVRVDLGSGAQRGGGWTGGGASNAGLRSDGYGMVPGAGEARHLRIQVNPDYR